MEPLQIKLTGRQANELTDRIIDILGQDVSLWLHEPQNTDTPQGKMHPCEIGHLANAIIAAILEPIDPPDPEQCLKEAVTHRETYEALRTLVGNVDSEERRETCAVCYDPLGDGEEITDCHGKNWPIHRGACAQHAGVPDDGFEPGPYRLGGSK
jgi:hypothetical protein